MNDIRTAMDAIDPDILIYGEPWTADTTYCPKPTAVQGNMGKVSAEIAAFNDKSRDAIKGSNFNATDKDFIQGAALYEDRLKGSIQANSTTMSGNSMWSKQPSQTVTYTSAHDNYTLYDKLVSSCKGGAGFGNRYDDLVAMNKMAGGIILTSQGMSFFQAGEEFARTKYGDENSYKSATATNQLVWSNTITYSDLMSYYKGLIEIRKAYSPFRDPTNTSNGTMYFSWADEGFPANVVAFTMYNKINPGSEWDFVGVIHNAGGSAQTVSLMTFSDKTLPSSWVIIADGSSAGIKSLGVSGSRVTVPARSTVVLVDKTSFDNTVISTGCKVTVNHVLKSTGSTYKTETLNGKEGAAYNTNPLSELTSSGYTVSSVSGQTTGTFTKSGTTVTYYYTLDTSKYATVTVKYQDAETGKSIAADDVSSKLIGSTYSVSPKSISGYECDTSLTSNASGTVAQGGVTVVFRYNEAAVQNLKVHYYNSQGWSQVYMYVYRGKGDSATQLTGAWPGTVMTSEGSGWYVGTVNTDQSALFIATAGASGPQDPSGINPDGYSVSGEIWIKGGKLYQTGKVNVRYETTDGVLLEKETIKGVADGSASYSTKAKSFDGYELVTTPVNATGLFTEADITVTYVYRSTVQPADPLANGSKLSVSTIDLGSGVTVNCSASGGQAPYTYEVKYKADTASSYTTVQSYSATSTLKITPTAAGDYTVSVTVKDSAGTTKERTLSFTVNGSVSDKLTNSTTVSSKSITVGSSVTVNCAASGGTAPYQYGVYYKKESSSTYSTAQAYGTNKTVKVTPSAATKYNIRVKIKDASGTIATKDFTISVTAAALTNECTISAAKITKGQSVTVTGAASGGTTPYQYAVYYKKSSSSAYTLVRDYKAANTIKVTPTAVGSYDVLAKVKDGKGTIAKKTFTVQVTSAETAGNASKVSATAITLGQDVKITLAGSGVPTPCTYAVYYKKAASADYTLGQAFGENSVFYFTPQTATTYNIRTKVKDSSGKVYNKDFTVKVTAASGLVNLSSVSVRTVKLGSTVTVKANASGGTKPYIYSVLYKKSSSENYTTVFSNSSKTSASIKPGAATAYTVLVKAKDSAGTVKSKTFTITVTK